MREDSAHGLTYEPGYLYSEIVLKLTTTTLIVSYIHVVNRDIMYEVKYMVQKIV
jgi:hypothetical protein